MPYQTDNSCVETAFEAVQYFAAKQEGSIVQIGTSQYVVSAINTSDTTVTYKFTDVGSTASITKTISVNSLPCTKLTVADGIQLSWLVVAAWVSSYAIKLIAKSVQLHLNGASNDS